MKKFRFKSRYIVPGIIATNVGVYLGWKYSFEMAQQRDFKMLKFMDQNFTLSYRNIFNGKWWTGITSAFSHVEFWHLAVNMYMFYTWSPPLISALGGKLFASVYLLSGIGSSIFSVFHNRNSNKKSVGASGCLTGTMALYALMWPRTQVYLMFIIPMRMWFVVPAFVLYDLYGTVHRTSGTIDTAGHLGGACTGALFWYFCVRNRIFY